MLARRRLLSCLALPAIISTPGLLMPVRPLPRDVRIIRRVDWAMLSDAEWFDLSFQQVMSEAFPQGWYHRPPTRQVAGC